MTNNVIQNLEKIGLSPEQSKIYEFLTSINSATARKISLATNINRSLVYKILNQLIEMGLVSENKIPGLISRFIAAHPSKLNILIEKHTQTVKIASNAFDIVSSQLISQFNIANNKPNVRFYEGVSGLETLYKDIINTKQNIFLLRSHLDDDTIDRERMIKNQIKNQVQYGISTKIISTKDITRHPNLIKEDQENKVERCQVPHEDFNVPAQMLIYGDKVSFTSFKDPMITTIIEDKNISETCLTVFNNIWKKYS